MSEAFSDGLTSVEVLLTPERLHASLREDARAGLTSQPRWLPPKYFYDARGSRLFEEITRLPEYYPTRAEQALLEARAHDIAAAADGEVLVELGSGSSTKTRLLLDAMRGEHPLTAYMPVDVSESAVREAVPGLRAAYPDLAIRGVVADFDHHLDHLPVPGRRMMAFLGSTLGNYPPEGRKAFLTALASGLEEGETLLLGLDLVKDPARLVAAYDDAAGVTAEFNRNVLRVLNAELDADFDPERFAHVARWDADQEWVEMRLRALDTMHVRMRALDLEITLQREEEIRTEISAKFRRERAEAELGAAGLTLAAWWTDGDYALALARR